MEQREVKYAILRLTGQFRLGYEFLSRIRVVLLVLREALGLGLLAGISFAFPVTRLLRKLSLLCPRTRSDHVCSGVKRIAPM